jgi:rhomboid protease GluP
MFVLSYIFIFAIMAILIVLFFLPDLIDFGKGSESSRFALIQKLWKDNEYIREGDWYRLFTANFVHLDGLHLLSNLYGFYIFAASPLFLLQPVVLLAVFILSGVGANLLSLFLNPSPSLGASGGVFGLIGYTLGAFLFLGAGLFQIQFLLLYIGISFAYAFAPGSRVDLYGHLGGLVTGLMLSFLV